MTYYRNKNFINTRPLYFPDKHYVVIAYKNIFEIHNQKHAIICKFEYDNNVVALEMSLNDEAKFFIGYENGDIKICDILTGSINDVMKLDAPLLKIFVLVDSLLAVQKDGIYLYEKYDQSLKKLIVKKAYSNISYDNKTDIIALAENKELLARKLSGDIEKRTFMNQWKQERRFTCIACHPTHNSIATGDTSGQVIIWWNALNGFKQTSIYHWHFLQLNYIEFNVTGTHLLTGGNEGVIVKWELAIQDSEKSRRFYPRLESQVKSIRSCCAEDGEYYLLTLTDNSYHVITDSFDPITSYHNLVQRSQFLHKKIETQCRLNPVGLVSCQNMPDPLRHCLMATGHEGKLQFFDTDTNEVSYQLDVARQNWPTETENDLVPGFIQVHRVAVSHCGRYLATYERLAVPNNAYDHIRNIKFFHWTDNQKFELQHVIPFDSTDIVTDLIFHPSKNSHVVIITKSMKLYLVSRIVSGEHIRWESVHIVEVDEVLYRVNVSLANKKHHHDAVLATIGCSHIDSDGLLVIGCNTSLTVYLWSHLLSFKTQPLIAKRMDKLMYGIAMDKKTKDRIIADVVSVAVVGHDTDRTRYRLSVGLHHGLLIAELTLSMTGNMDMTSVFATILDKNGQCMVAHNEARVAVMFRNNNKLMTFDIWNIDARETAEVPSFEQITWTLVADGEGGEKWVVAGLMRAGHSLEIATCEEEPRKEPARIVSEDSCGVDLLSDLASTEVVVKTERKTKRPTKRSHDGLAKTVVTYDGLDPTAMLAFLYKKN